MVCSLLPWVRQALRMKQFRVGFAHCVLAPSLCVACAAHKKQKGGGLARFVLAPFPVCGMADRTKQFGGGLALLGATGS